MNEQPRNKMLVIIIGILLAANIVMLSFFIFNNNKKERNTRDSYVTDYLKNEVGFDARQLASYDSLSRKHREQLKSDLNRLSSGRREIFSTLAAHAFNDSAIHAAAAEMHDEQKIFEVGMLQNLKAIRDICTKDQLTRFDTGFYKIFVKKRETRR